MTVVEQELSAAQRLIYGRKRIVDALYQDQPDKFGSLQVSDIQSISLEDDLICCDLGECLLYVERSKVISNFWKHRTRTPSYFTTRSGEMVWLLATGRELRLLLLITVLLLFELRWNPTWGVHLVLLLTRKVYRNCTLSMKKAKRAVVNRGRNWMKTKKN